MAEGWSICFMPSFQLIHFSTNVLPLFQWMSVKRGNRRIITGGFAFHFPEKKKTTAFLEKMYWERTKQKETESCCFSFFVEVDYKKDDNSSAANAKIPFSDTVVAVVDVSSLIFLTLPVVGEGESTFNSNSAELLLVSAPTSPKTFTGEVQGFSAGESGKALGTRLIVRTKESKTSFWLRNLCRGSAVVIRVSLGKSPWHRYKTSYIFMCPDIMFLLVGPAFFSKEQYEIKFLAISFRFSTCTETFLTCCRKRWIHLQFKFVWTFASNSTAFSVALVTTVDSFIICRDVYDFKFESSLAAVNRI